MKQSALAPELSFRGPGSSSRGTQGPEASRGRGNRNCKQWRPGLLRSPNKPGRRAAWSRLGEGGITDIGLHPRYSLQPRDRPPSSRPKPHGVWDWGVPIGLPQMTRPTETPDPELTQLAREKTPSTAPMVTLVMQAADREASSAVVTASRGVSSETRRFLRPETRGWRHCVAPPTALGRRGQESLCHWQR